MGSRAAHGGCDETGVAVQVLSTVPVMFSYWAKAEHGNDLARLLNDHLAGVVAGNSRRFAGLGTLPMQDADLACRELERCVRELGLPGVQIGTNVNGRNLDDRELFSVVWNWRYRHGRGSVEDFNPQTPRSLSGLLRDSGFEILDVRLTNFYMHLARTRWEIDGCSQENVVARLCERLFTVRPWGDYMATSINMLCRKR